MIKVIIIEDEVNNRELLQQMLEQYCSDVQVVGIAVDVPSGIELVKRTQPDVLFLDVEMPGGTGFDILNAFDVANFKVVFVTGYDHYAIKAIKYAALDYLLKPVSLTELRQAVEKVKEATPNYTKSLEFFKEQIDNENEPINQIVISDNKNHRVIRIEDIVFVAAERTYATFYLDDHKKYVATNPLNFYEELLPDTSFFRIHKSYIVNCQKVTKLEAGRGGPVHLEGGAKLPVAFRRKSSFMRFLDDIA